MVGFYAFRRTFEARFAAIVGPAFFFLGAGAGHIYQIIKTNNFAPGNAGTPLLVDFVFPLIGFALLWLNYRLSRSKGNAEGSHSRGIAQTEPLHLSAIN